MTGPSLERLLQRDRWIAGAGLVFLGSLGWIYILGLNDGSWPALMAMPMRHGWSVMDLLLTYLMWLTMMIAMMIPVVAPVVLLISTVERRRGQTNPLGRAILALAGYLMVWAAACIALTLVQFTLHEAGLIRGAMSPLKAGLAGATLVLVGIYEVMPAKAACLRLCRSPIESLGHYWRPDPGGSFLLGLRHGLYCLGCCWALMLLLFVTGVMNIMWVGFLSALVLAEKLVPRGLFLSRLAGAAIIAWGAVLTAQSW
jgi:predicted metal-binding membrane protein